MAEETITIFRADTGDAVRSIGDLKASIATLKKDLDSLDIGSKEYADTLVQLQTQQAALKNAMHDTSYESDGQVDSFAANARAAKGLGDSYNALVRRMADLDQQFRATEDAAQRAKLGAQIKEINDQLKAMDEARGKFGRNVGNYKSAAEGFAEVLRAMPPTLGAAATGIKKVGTSLALVGKQPILGIIGLLAPIIMRIADGLKDNETALGAVNKLLGAMKPVADFFAGILEKIAGFLAQAVDWVLELAQRSGISFNKIVSGAVGVGNALKEFLLTPIRNIIDGVKGLGNVLKDVFSGDFKKAVADAKQAVTDIGDNFRKGFAFKGNYEAGVNAGEIFVSGLKSPKVKKSAAAAGKDVMDAFLKSLENEVIEEEDLSKIFVWDPDGERRKENQEMFDELIRQRDEYDAEMARRAEWERAAAESAAADDKARLKARTEAYIQYAGAIGDVFSSIADIYEANGEADEKAAQKAKALRTAGAIVSTISGAVSAFMSTWSAAELPLTAKIVLAPLNAAAVLAAGYAQIKQINAVKVGSGGGGVSAPATAAVAAPAFDPSVPSVRNVTGKSEVERLNRMGDPQRVYILASDLQAERDDSRVRVRETTW